MKVKPACNRPLKRHGATCNALIALHPLHAVALHAVARPLHVRCTAPAASDSAMCASRRRFLAPVTPHNARERAHARIGAKTPGAARSHNARVRAHARIGAKTPGIPPCQSQMTPSTTSGQPTAPRKSAALSGPGWELCW